MKLAQQREYPSPWHAGFRKFVRNVPAVIGTAVFLAIALSCLLAPVITDNSYITVDTVGSFSGFSREHPLGTDALGRDLLTRLLYGGRVTLGISFTALLLGALAGTVTGIISGYYGGRLDALLIRVVEALSAVPAILLVVAVECTLGWGEGNYRYAIALSLIPPFAKVIRASVMTIVGNEYIEAARALGLGDIRIIFHHILRNIAAPFLVQISSTAAETLLTCTIVGYLGFGVNPPTPEWGGMVAMSYNLIRSKPTVGLLPCIIIVLCSISLNLMGNGLRDAFDTGNRPE